MNIYDEKSFFEAYSQMSRSQLGLKGAGEWHQLKEMLPSLKNKNILDLGCGYGWHCKYMVDQGAFHVLGIDASKKMLEVACQKNAHERIQYEWGEIENYNYLPNTYDLVFSSLVMHYIEDYPKLCVKIYDCLKEEGIFIFSCEHPIFTAYGNQDWYYDEQNEILHWPVDHYFEEKEREAIFLGHSMTKYHRTLTTYLMTLIECGFMIEEVIEPTPAQELIEEMKEELRRPMMLLIRAKKVKK